MELHPVPDPTGDPFVDAVRRRHPDVDVVLLPPEPPPPGPDQVVDEDLPRATLARVATLARQLWASTARDSDVVPETRLAFGDGPGAVRAAARVATRRDDGFHVLVALRHELETHGWEVTRPPGAVERVEAHLDDLVVTASYVEGAGALLFQVWSGSLAVGPERARELTCATRGGR
ncbi:hypothetical protein [Nocardioides sp. 503]|uniref:hypothetical protein n=1 Tax=Nocardioides sp. 503 TaxID=2508326 RepID=UPI00106F4F1A|nr:hypothetical protein [Nocardioides sp. 503]